MTNCRPAYREMLVDYFEPYRDRLDEDCRTRLSKNPLRVFDCKVDGGKDFVLAAPTITDHLCQPCARRTSRPCARGWTRPASRTCSIRGWCGVWTTTRGRRSSGSRAALASDAGVDGQRGRAVRRARGGSRRAADPGRGVRAWGWIGCSWRSRRRARRCRRLGHRGASWSRSAPRRRGWAASSSPDLRTEGISAAGSYEERPLKAQLKMADRAGAAFVAILGEQELADGTVTLRRLVDGVQKSVPIGGCGHVADQARRMGGLR